MYRIGTIVFVLNKMKGEIFAEDITNIICTKLQIIWFCTFGKDDYQYIKISDHQKISKITWHGHLRNVTNFLLHNI